MPDTAQGGAGSASNPFLNAKLLEAAAASMEMDLGKVREAPEYMALKLAFTPSRGDVGCALCQIFEGATGNIIEEQLWVTRPYTQKALKPNREWRSFLKMFPQLGNYDKISADKLTLLLPELITDTERMELFSEGKSAVKRYLIRVEGQVRKGFERATMCFFDVTSDVELITRSDLEDAKILEKVRDPNAPPEENDSEEEKTSQEESGERSVIKCLPIVDPVRGKSASQIVPGDILEVGLEEESAGVGASALVRKFLEETGQAPTFPVEEVSRRDDKTYIYLHISDEIQGVLTLTKDLRLKMKRANSEKPQDKHVLENLFFFVLLGIALVGLLMALKFLFFL